MIRLQVFVGFQLNYYSMSNDAIRIGQGSLQKSCKVHVVIIRIGFPKGVI